MRVPDAAEINWDANAAYAHVTSNNTIFGTQFQTMPDSGAVPLVCDASSDIFSRPIDVPKYGLIYAGAQKNLGPSGVTLVIMRKELLARSPKSLPTMLNYGTHAENESMFNTPPCFGIYILGLVAKWLKGLGGLEARSRRSTSARRPRSTPRSIAAGSIAATPSRGRARA